MTNNQHLLAMLERHEPTFKEELKFRYDTFNFVKENLDFWQRSNLAGHITGSAWVLSPDGESVLLIHHKKLDRWLQPGGHVDETDASAADTALREATEECGLSGLTLLSSRFFDVDVHEIPERGHEPTHFHYDLRFAFRAASMDFDANSLEVKNIRWVPLAELIAEGTEQSIRRMALKSVEGNHIFSGF
ncbi:MAG: NUDIX hydrolase [Saprospiraceae bacterium]|nr:NUDIX hydrolase [Saprospiraceae bacterium]MCF8251890.1 NUDIX hydrolase [Saprospiraceae bacterium]MCF8281617.1 NUDIX hydrolase [Bacteroidales bacterium]MCF8313594.1 NUDIX hydrolase [Saprospiraceae bacterium]MCF8442274.1 NUDIX hydrolase [Saprospiraceae bacterium]